MRSKGSALSRWHNGDHYRRSVMMIIAGGAFLSLLGIGVRLMDSASSLQIIFYRGVAQCLFLTLYLLSQNLSQPLKPFRTLGRLGWLASALIAGAGLFLVLAVRNTTVANAVFIVSMAPLTSALLGRLILHERVSSRTWASIIIAVVGVTIIFSTGLSGGGLLGMSYALVMVLMYSLSLITIRSQNSADMVAMCALSGLLLAVGVLPFIGSLQISLHDLVICSGLGIFQVGLGLVLITKGAQHVPTAQVSLLALLEVVLSPIWVWIGVGEVPSAYSLIGGAIVLTGVAIQAMQKHAPADVHQV